MGKTRTNQADGNRLFDTAPLVELTGQAIELRNSYNDPNLVTFVVDTNPNYTNVCLDRCTFCSFYRNDSKSEDAYTHSSSQMVERIQTAYENGATTVLLQGGHNPDIGMEFIEKQIRDIQMNIPDIHIHPFSPSEIVSFSRVDEVSTRSVLERLWELGIRTMPGGGAEILVDRVRRKISPKKIDSDTWLGVMREAHQVGFKTSATMMYGHVESDAEIIEHFIRLRELQDETGGFYAFIPWSFKLGASPLSKLVDAEALPSRYSRIIAMARIMLDNIPHIQASWFGEGWRAGQVALNSGADDFGGVLLEENVLFSAQHKKATNTASVASLIFDAGFTPVQRTTGYEHLETYSAEAAPELSSRNPIYERQNKGSLGEIPVKVIESETA